MAMGGSSGLQAAEFRRSMGRASAPAIYNRPYASSQRAIVLDTGFDSTRLLSISARLKAKTFPFVHREEKAAVRTHLNAPSE
jgi:hypothetical protein